MKSYDENLPSLEEIEKIKSERHLNNFIKYAWHTIEPNNPFIENWHIDCISEHLEAVNYGQIKRLLINIPPRFLKSITATVMYPVWTWVNNPYKRFISLSYSDTLTLKHANSRRNVIMSRWFQQKWGNVFYIKIPRSIKNARDKGKDVNTEKNTQHLLENDKRGFFFSSSIRGTITGEGGDVIIIDDAHNPKTAESDAERNATVEIFKSTIQSRLNNLKTGAIIVVMQRLHEKDISGHILSTDNSYVHLKLPAKAIKSYTVLFPVSKLRKEVQEGELLFEKRVGDDELEKQKKSMGSYAYSGQYLQDPVPDEGGIIKKHWIRYWQYPGQNLRAVIVRNKNGEYEEYKPVVLPADFDEQLQSWDLAFKSKQDSDFVCGEIFAGLQGNIYMLDMIMERFTFTETIHAVRNMTERYPKAYCKLIEDKANGPAVIDILKNEIPGLIPVEPMGDKTSRLHTASVPLESGNVYLPHPDIYPWVEDLIEHLIKFPKLEHDDDVDAFSQGIIHLLARNKRVVIEEVEW